MTDSIGELMKMLADAKANRLKIDPQQTDERFGGFIQGIEGAIYRLQMGSGVGVLALNSTYGAYGICAEDDIRHVADSGKS